MLSLRTSAGVADEKSKTDFNVSDSPMASHSGLVYINLLYRSIGVASLLSGLVVTVRTGKPWDNISPSLD